MVIPPRWKSKEYKDILNSLPNPSKGTNLGGSWNIVFVNSTQVDKGTVSHELAHTLGQGRELYKER